MRAREILESTPALPEPMSNIKIVSTSPDDTYYEINSADFQKLCTWIATGFLSDREKAAIDAAPLSGARYFFSAATKRYDLQTNTTQPQTWINWPRYPQVSVFVLSNDVLTQILDQHHVHNMAAFKKFIQYTGAERGMWLPFANKQMILRNGKLMPRKTALESLRVGQLSDNSIVYRGSDQDKDILFGENTAYGPQWGTLYCIDSPVAGRLPVIVDNNKITNKPWNPSRLAASLKALNEFCKTYKVLPPDDLPELPKATKPRLVKPGSNFHKMLDYVSKNPGCTRTDWYVKYLGNEPQGMPGWTGSTAWDGIAASKGLINNTSQSPGKFSLHITSAGSFVLSMLDNGHKVDINQLED